MGIPIRFVPRIRITGNIAPRLVAIVTSKV